MVSLRNHDVIHLGEAGGFKEPELMQNVFACMSSIFKHLQKLLAADVRKVRVAIHTVCFCYLQRDNGPVYKRNAFRYKRNVFKSYRN